MPDGTKITTADDMVTSDHSPNGAPPIPAPESTQSDAPATTEVTPREVEAYLVSTVDRTTRARAAAEACWFCWCCAAVDCQTGACLGILGDSLGPIHCPCLPEVE